MDEYFETENFDSPWWNKKKDELIKSIDEALEKEQTDLEVLVLMREMVSKAKVRVSMEEFFKEKI